jgi:transposase-like protein
MPLVDLSMVEQRYAAVREVLDGATVKDTALRYGVDRKTLHRWLVRYGTQGLAALADKSRLERTRLPLCKGPPTRNCSKKSSPEYFLA